MRQIVLFALLSTAPLSIAHGENPPATLLPLDSTVFDAARAAHLLSRAGFGATPQEAQALALLGLEKAVSSLVEATAVEATHAFEPVVTDRPSRDDLKNKTQEERKKLVREQRRKDQGQFQSLRGWWLQRMTLSTRPLVEKMTLFWHGHFATSQREVKNSHHMWLQNTTLRTHALGNFKNLVRAIAKDPAMLAYLNNNQNNRSRPNENFARELLELFTLGIGNYTENDVKEAARALTGWTFRGNEFVFARRAHDDGEKTFLGKTGKLTGDEVIDIIFEQPAASRFVVRKLFVYFAHEEPSAETIETLAKTFRDSSFEVRPVLTQMFGSAEFYSPRAMGNRVKSPVELVVGTLRLLKIDPGTTPALAQVAGRMGQDIFAPPSVKGWDGGQAWISTSTVFDRYNFTRPLLALDEAPRNRPAGAGKGKGAAAGKKRPNDRARARLPHWDAKGFEVEVLGKESSSLSTAEAVDRVLKRFLMVNVSAESRKQLEELYSRANPEVRLAELIHVLLSSPEYQVG